MTLRIRIASGFFCLVLSAVGRTCDADSVSLYDNTGFAADDAVFAALPDQVPTYAQQFVNGDALSVTVVELALQRSGLLGGQIHVDVWDDDGFGTPRSVVGRLGSISADALAQLDVPFAPPIEDVERIAVEGLVSGLQPNEAYYIALDLTDADYDGIERNIQWLTRESADGVDRATRLLGFADQFGWVEISAFTGIPTVSYALMSVTGITEGDLLLGDFNSDALVNGADFLVWQRGGSPNPLSASDLAEWET
ncbi:MAG: hypothetical protein AAF961_14355, partial [Planctomycetota bacterium]